MPTYERLPRFDKDYAALSAEERAAFKAAARKFVEDVKHGRGFRKSLRVKGVQGSSGVYEMTWANDGRATFQYGESPVAGETHIVWRRIGTHAVLSKP